MGAALRAIDRALSAAAIAATMLLLALMSVITLWQVITRFVLEQPSTWSEVAARSLMIWMVYLGLAVVLRSGTLIAIDVLMERLTPPMRKALSALIALVTLCVLGVMVWAGWAMASRTVSQSIAGLFNPFTGDPVSISLVYAAIPVGAALSAVAVIARLAEVLAGQISAHPHAPPPIA